MDVFSNPVILESRYTAVVLGVGMVIGAFFGDSDDGGTMHHQNNTAPESNQLHKRCTAPVSSKSSLLRRRIDE